MTDKATLRTVIRFGPFTLDGSSGELRNGPTRLKVPDQSIAVLQALLEQPGELVTREALRDRLWGADTFVDFEAGLNAAVRRLREALHDSADKPSYIETLPRRGYRFVAPVDGVPSGSAEAQARDIQAPATPAAGARRNRARHALLATLGIAAIGAAVWIGRGWSGRASTAPDLLKPMPITRFPGLELDPAIAPNAPLVAFAWEGEHGDNFDIYLRPLDGSGLTQLTTDASDDHAPVWSPDGQRIAWVRVRGARREIIVRPAFGGTEQRLFEAGPEIGSWRTGGVSRGLSWAPDGDHIVFSDGNPAGTSSIYVYSQQDGQKRQLTSPPTNFSDIYPVVSPDGRYLGFVRVDVGSVAGYVYLQRLDRLQPVGEPFQLTFGHFVQAFDWFPDSSGIVYDGFPSEPGLWRIKVGGGTAEPVMPNLRAAKPSVSRSGAGLVYQTAFVDSNIWEVQAPASPKRTPSGDATRPVVVSTSVDLDGQISPDGTRIVFQSHRSGNREIWVSKRDGSESAKLTNFEGYPGSPRWSANGQWIAFDGMRTGTWNLYYVSGGGGPVHTLTSDTFSNIRPSWSSDGRWIYFGSNRTGDWQIWRIAFAGGPPIQVTQRGGMEAIVSPDGRHVYYAKEPPAEGIWQVSPEGGEEVKIVPRGRALNFDVTDTGIFIMDTSAKPQATVERFDFASKQIVPVAWLPPGLHFANVSYLNVTRDGRTLLYVQYDQWMSDIEMLREFR